MIDGVQIIDWQAVRLTLKLAGLTTLVLIIFGIPLAWWLATSKSKRALFVETLVSLPLVLPPTVLGFYLLVFLGPNMPLKIFGEVFHFKGLVFSFTGLVIGSVIYSLPFVIQPLKNTFLGIQKVSFEVAMTLRASPLDTFFTVILPQSSRGIITAAILGLAHTIGEFGVVLMIGGNIPGETRVLSIAIYDHVEALEFEQAHFLAGGLLAFSFVTLLVVHFLNRKTPNRVGAVL